MLSVCREQSLVVLMLRSPPNFLCVLCRADLLRILIAESGAFRSLTSSSSWRESPLFEIAAKCVFLLMLISHCCDVQLSVQRILVRARSVPPRRAPPMSSSLWSSSF
ncbi:hypothetical protein HN51_067081 [Arachis hypogaea]